MKKKFLKRLVTGSCAAIFGLGIYAYGCADGWWGSGYSSIFSPEITVNNTHYEPFFYDDYTVFYKGYNIQKTSELFKELNVADWTNYLKKYSPETVAYYLYDDEVFNALSEIYKSKNIKQAFKEYQFTHKIDLSDFKTELFVTFLTAARGIETFSNQTYNYWDYDNYKPTSADKKFVSHIESLYNLEAIQKDDFLKNRVWFQLIRSKFYSEDRSSVIDFFNKTAANQPKNHLYYQALNYLGGAYKSQKNFKQANITFAKVFKESKPLMPSALFDYKPLPKDDFNAMLNLSKDTSVNEVLLAMQGYYTNEFQALQDLYKLNPASEHIDFLLSRWVNINEQQINIYNEYQSIDVDPKKVKKDIKSKINTSQLLWINEVANAGKVKNPYIWKAAAAYFNTLNSDYSKADHYIKDAYKLANTLERKGQIINLRLLNNLLSTDKMDATAEGKLIEDVNWLFYDKANVEYDYYTTNNRVSYLQQFVKKYIAALYKQQNNNVMSELVFSINGFYKDQKQSVAMEKLLLSNQRTAWQDIFVGIYPFKLADIYESRGIYLFYQDKIDEAIAEFEKITPYETKQYDWETEKYQSVIIDYKNQELPGNPFNGKIKDCNDCDHVAKQSIKYSQINFLKKIKEMKEKIANGEDVYNNALLVGNAFYNASYFGNARAFYYNSIIGEYSNSITKEHQNMLYGMKNVEKYYSIAKNATDNNEHKAKMAYLLAKVERNNFYSTNYFMTKDYYYAWGDNVVIKKWQGFQELKSNYSDTKYYQEVIAECGYFRRYLGLQ